MSFDVMEFLKEHGEGAYDDTKFRGEVLRTKVEAGIGVFAGRDSKFWPVTNNKLTPMIKKSAQEYADALNLSYEPKVIGAIRQTWLLPVISKETQPNWSEGRWEEMKRRTVVQVNGDWKETGDWLLFISQWTGDNPPMNDDHFNKEVWVHAVFRPHPDFNEDLPDKYTCQMRDGNFILDKDGKPKPALIRVVKEVIGETEAEARAWYAARVNDKEVGAEDYQGISDVSASIAALYKEIPNGVCNESEWAGWGSEIFSSIHNKENVDGWVEVGIPQGILDKVRELTAQYPAF
jgi:hypothetical protein